MERRFLGLGRWLYRRRLAVVIGWVLLVMASSLGAKQLPDHLIGGSGDIQGSQSQRMAEVIQREFDNPFSRLLMVTIASERHTVTNPLFQSWIGEAKARVMPFARRVTTHQDDARLVSKDGRRTILMVGLDAADGLAEERAVPRIRQALETLKQSILAADETARFAVTGNAAISYDINEHNKSDGEKAEAKALPLTLVVLILAFGALVAAGVPLIIGIVGTTVAMGAAFTLTHWMPLSNLLQNIVTMIGLAVGIDYSLLLVSRYREALKIHDVPEAVAQVVSKAGPAVVFSGLTVMIGLLSLMFSPLMEMQSIGIGGALVVVVSVTAAVTLLPAILGLIGRNIDWPLWLSRPLRHPKVEDNWRKVANWVMERPVRVMLACVAAIALIAFPVTRMHLGFPTSTWFPRSMEARTGAEILTEMGNANAVVPIRLVVRAQDGLPALEPSHMPSLVQLGQQLQNDTRISQVASPVNLRSDLGLLEYVTLYADPDQALKDYPQIGEFFVSKDRSAVLFQVIASNQLGIRDVQALAKELASTPVSGPFSLEVGGDAVFYNDFNESLGRSYPMVMMFVVGVTLLVLFFAFRSYLLPIKAVVMNMLSVAAGYGAVVAVFQLGWAKWLVGLEQPLDAIPMAIPIMIFCIVFGLSMDYEVFLLSRMKELYDETGDNRYATAEGLASTGSIITSAALIMVVVFGAFSWAEIAIIKMIGFGLAVAVLVDATLIRVLLVPSVMRLAGDWNWTPGDRQAASLSKPPTPTHSG